MIGSSSSILKTLGLSEKTVQTIMQSPAIHASALIGFAVFGDEADFSPRKEANVLTALAFRNGPLEDFHASGRPIGNQEMKDLTNSVSRRLNSLLRLRDILMSDPGGQQIWRRAIVALHETFCHGWESEDIGESV